MKGFPPETRGEAALIFGVGQVGIGSKCEDYKEHKED